MKIGCLLLSAALTKKSVPAINLKSNLELMLKKDTMAHCQLLTNCALKTIPGKSKKPETKATSEPTSSEQSNLKKLKKKKRSLDTT